MRRLSPLLAFFLLIVWVAFAQIDRAVLTGTVQDQTGAVIPGAGIEAVNVATGVKTDGRSNSSGIYRLPGLPVGNYTVTVSRDGFESEKIDNVLLQVGLTRILNAQLKVGATSQDIEVQATAPAEQTSPQLSGVINTQQIASIPVNGRNWATLLVLAPGAIDDGGGDQRTIRFAGRGRDDNNYMIDGVDATGIQEQAQKSSTRLQISEDAVEEYRVSSALYSAEYGAGDGGQVDIVSKSGTNNWHGDVFEFFRNSDLDARAFNDFDAFTGKPVIPPFHLNQYGLTLGGPIVKDKTFFFISYEGLRQSQNRTLVANVLSVPLRDAIVATSPALAPIVAAYPTGNTNFGVCNNPVTDPCVDQFLHQGSIDVNEDSWLVRLDHKFTENTTFYARAQRDVSFTEAPLGNLHDTQQINTHPANYLLALEHTFSPTLFNEFKFGINRAPFHNPQASLLPFDVTSNAFDELFNNNTDNEVGTSLAFIDNVSKEHGKHTFKAGIEVRRVRLNQGITADDNYSFTDNASLINNQLDSANFRQTWCCRGLRHTYVLPYFEDEWKMRPNLTLNLGIRWEYYSVITEQHDRMTVFDLACGGICPAGSPAYFPNYLNFDPRIGIAWAPSALHDKTVVRAGFGIYSGAGQNDDLNASLESNTTRFAVSQSDLPTGETLSFPVNEAAFPGGTFLAPRALNRHRRDMYVEEYGFSVQQQMPGGFMFTPSYIGSHGVRLFARNYVNLCEQPFDGTNCIRPLPNFSQIDIKYNNGTSHFDALELALQRRMAQGWTIQTQYMWSHSLNDGSVGGGEANAPENFLCERCDYGPSVFDIRHNLVVASTYELPFGPGRKFLNGGGPVGKVLEGWDLSGMHIWHTGHPLTVLIGLDGSQTPDGDFRADQRPDVVPGVSVIPQNQGPNNWININAFAMPPVDANGVITHFGDASRGLVRAPHVWETDFSLSKTTKLTERTALEFRAEAFNIFNHTQFGDPSQLDILGSNFGQINTTVAFNNNNDNFAPPNTGLGLPRQLQLGLKFKF